MCAEVWVEFPVKHFGVEKYSVKCGGLSLQVIVPVVYIYNRNVK